MTRDPDLRSQINAAILLDRLAAWGIPAARGAEIGVWEGHAAAALLRFEPLLLLWAVDRWTPPPAGDSWSADIDPMAALPAARFEEARCEAIRRLTPFNARVRLMAMDALKAAAQMPATLQFVWFDADPSERGLGRLLGAWWPWLVPGGLAGGYSWDNPKTGVRAAVTRFAAEVGSEVSLGPCGVWFIRKAAP